MGPATKQYPEEWIGQKVTVIHMGGSNVKDISEGVAHGELVSVNPKVDPANGIFIPHILLKGDDDRIAFIPFNGITYISTRKPTRR